MSEYVAGSEAESYRPRESDETILRRDWQQHYAREAAGLAHAPDVVDALTTARLCLDDIRRHGFHADGAAVGQATARRVRLEGKVAAYEAEVEARRTAGKGTGS